MRRALLTSLALHAAVLGGTFWWLSSAPAEQSPLVIRVDLGVQTVPARRANATQARVTAPVPELPPAHELPPASPERTGENTGTAGDQGGPVIDALTPGQSLEKPALLGYPAPEYPRAAQQRGWEGVVEALVTVDAAGRLTEVAVARSSGHPELDAAALSALRAARYKPGTDEGVPTTATMTVTVRFRLQ